MDREFIFAALFARGPSGRQIRRQRARFDAAFRDELPKMARLSPRLRDLTFSFPALAAALAADHGDAKARDAAIRLTIAGAPLKAIAAALGVPMWLRRLPPEAFRAPLDGLFVDPPDAARRFAPLAPEGADAAAAWLACITRALKLGDGDFALWIARQTSFFERFGGEILADAARRDAALQLLAAYVFGLRHRDELLGMVAADRWSAKASLARVAGGLGAWFDRVLVDLGDGEMAFDPTWRGVEQEAGYGFVPLATEAALQDEGEAMGHCVGSYWEDVAMGRSLIFSVRRDCARVATLEVCDDGAGAGMVEQLLGYANAAAPEAVWTAAQAFVARTGVRPISGFEAGKPLMSDETWAAIWAPFLAAAPDRAAATLFDAPPRRQAALLPAALDLWERAAKPPPAEAAN